MDDHESVGVESYDGISQLDGSEFIPPPLRLAVGLGDPAREREILPRLGESSPFVVTERCLSADQLLSCLQTESIDAVLVAADLHRLSERMLGEIARTGVPLVILAPSVVDGTWRSAGTVVPADAHPDTIREALLAAVRGERLQRSPLRVRSDEAPSPTPDETQPSPTLALFAIASGHGSPGRTTVALNLAIALGAVAPTLLLDADLGGASVAAFLDADPTRNLTMVAHTSPETPGEWERVLAQETQPLAARSPHGAVLCGIPKPELRSNVTPHFFERLLTEARQRYRYVIVDVGAELLGAEVPLHRLTLGLADQILLVSTADLVGLWHARSALRLLRTHLGIPPGRVALLINRYDRRYHHGRAEIEWTLGVPAAAVIPEDHAGAQRALAAQRPLVLDRRSRAGRAALHLAERIHGGRVILPPESPSGSRQWPWMSLRTPRSRSLGHRSGAAGRLGG